MLGGTGTVGIIVNTAGGVIAPGASPGILTSSNVTFGASSDFTVELNGATAGTGYDQLNVRGTNNLAGATLNVNVAFGASDPPTEGSQFVILNNDAAEAITGTFAGLPNGTIFAADGFIFRINYNGGSSSNDVVLTLTNLPLDDVSTTVAGGNADGVIGPNECNLLSIVITNKGASAITGISATLVSETAGVAVTQPFSAYPDVPASTRRTNSALFQVSTAPTFICGQIINLKLIVQTASLGSFAIPVTLTSGSVGATSSFSTNVTRIIPDGGSTNSTLTVLGIGAPIAKVTVSMYIVHTSDADLDIFLQGPDGTVVELTTDNGGSGNSYGSACAPTASCTTFDDSAPAAITAGSAPFVGTFRPEGKLSDFIGKSGAAANGVWTLLMTDDTLNALNGELQCWTLTISAAACAPGSGACEYCPAVILNGAVTTNSPTETPRLFRGGVPSTCAAPTACPSTSGGTFNYEAYTFRNGPSNACISVTLDAPTADLFSAVYAGSFNPANLCLNYLADSGDSTITPNILPPTPTRTYSFNAASNQTFVVVVNNAAGPLGPFTLSLGGGDCRPLLNITPANFSQVKFDWTTAAAGFQLERTNKLGSGVSTWTPVTNVPVVINSRFTVTNNSALTNQFYRLRKPLP